MKRLFATFLLGLLLWPAAAMAQQDESLNAEQLALRTDLLNFLKEEGFMPEVDKDGDIKFKKEGNTFYFRVYKSNTDPMFVTLFQVYNYSDEYSSETVFRATKKLNLYKGVKVICDDTNFRITAELFVRNAEAAKHSFYKLMEMFGKLDDNIAAECEKAKTETPASASTGNTPAKQSTASATGPSGEECSLEFVTFVKPQGFSAKEQETDGNKMIHLVNNTDGSVIAVAPLIEKDSSKELFDKTWQNAADNLGYPVKPISMTKSSQTKHHDFCLEKESLVDFGEKTMVLHFVIIYHIFEDKCCLVNYYRPQGTESILTDFLNGIRFK